MPDPFRYFNSSPEDPRLAAMMYVRFPLSLRQVEDLYQRSLILTQRDRAGDRTEGVGKPGVIA